MSLTKLKDEEVIAFQEKIRNDPVWFVEKVLGKPLWEKEKEILLAIQKYPEVAVRSCNSAGKSFTAARVVHWWLMGHSYSVVVTTSPTARQNKEILWREIKDAVAGKSFYNPDDILETKINIADKWFAIGLSTDQPDQFQGIHSSHLLVVVDESSGVDDKIFEAIDGLKPSKILLIGNPLRNTGRFARAFKDPQVHKIHISAFDTPNVKEGKIVIPGLMSLEDIEKFKQRYGEDSDVYRVRILGEFPKSEANTFISIDEIAKAIDREIEVLPEWGKRMGVDVARHGGDRTVLLVRQNEKVLRKEVIVKQDLMEVVGQVIRIAREEKVEAENIFIDAIGYGAGVVDRLKEEGFDVQEINVAESAEDIEHYANLRAELYSRTKEWLKTGSLPKDDDFYELANIKYHFNSKGKLQIESKEDIKKRGLPSPDVSDALILTFAKRKTLSYNIPDGFGGVNWDRY